MNIQDTFREMRGKIRGAAVLLMMDSDGETILLARDPELDDYDCQLFGAQVAVLMSKEIENKSMNFLYMKGKDGAAAARMLPNGYFLCVHFQEPTHSGYAEQWLDRITEVVTEEFF